jgi:carboxymethylenebutenolidase
VADGYVAVKRFEESWTTMCFEFDALPPYVPGDRVIPRLAGGAAAERLTLTSADGTEFAAALAECPEPAGGPAVIVLPDVRGLYRFYADLTERFVTAGHHAIAIDYFGRTAGVGERGEDFEYMPHVMQTTPAQVQADIAAARDVLAQRTGATSFVAVGFCFGGAQADLAGTNAPLGLDAVVAFYGTLDPSRHGLDSPGFPAPLKHADEIRTPVLALFGGADAGIPPEDIEAFAEALNRNGVPHEIHTYPGAPHSFFDRSHEEHAEASADAWRRVLDFLGGVGAGAAV